MDRMFVRLARHRISLLARYAVVVCAVSALTVSGVAGCKSNEIIQNNAPADGDGGLAADSSQLDASSQGDGSQASADTGMPPCVLDDPAKGRLDNCIAQ